MEELDRLRLVLRVAQSPPDGLGLLSGLDDVVDALIWVRRNPKMEPPAVLMSWFRRCEFDAKLPLAKQVEGQIWKLLEIESGKENCKLLTGLAGRLRRVSFEIEHACTVRDWRLAIKRLQAGNLIEEIERLNLEGMDANSNQQATGTGNGADHNQNGASAKPPCTVQK